MFAIKCPEVTHLPTVIQLQLCYKPDFTTWRVALNLAYSHFISPSLTYKTELYKIVEDGERVSQSCASACFYLKR